MATRDLRREHFSDLPEPWKEQNKVKHEILGDKYMDVLERYIDQLSIHIRKIQDEELAVTNQFSAALSSLQAKSHDKRRMREDVARDVYQKKISKIREKRKKYREMLYDAQTERKKLIDSMQIQKDEDDILRRKLAKLSALSAAETSREQRKTSAFDKFAALFMVLQVAMFLIFGLNFDFNTDAKPVTAGVAPQYQFYSDIMMMAMVGFGFLMTFLRKYQYSAIGFTMLVTAFTFQWSLMVLNFFEMAYQSDLQTVFITEQDLIVAAYSTVTVLISFGAVLGIISSFQLLIMAFVEVILYGLNLYFIRLLQIYSTENGVWTAWGFGGDSTAVHIFGAYFGIAMAIPLGLRVKRLGKGKQDQADSYSSDMFAMIGTVFLWVLWPSFNAALAPANTQHRVIVNTVLALCSSVVFAFLGSRVFRGGKFDMTDIQNATLAGGVAMGNAASIIVGPGSALIIGAVAAVVSTLGYAYLSPLLQKVGVFDTRGVHNGHGLPGIIGALSSIVSVAIAFNDSPDGFRYGQSLTGFFALGQATAAWQVLSLIITMVVALVGGLILGFAMYPATKTSKRLFSDQKEFRTPPDFEITND